MIKLVLLALLVGIVYGFITTIQANLEIAKQIETRIAPEHSLNIDKLAFFKNILIRKTLQVPSLMLLLSLVPIAYLYTIPNLGIGLVLGNLIGSSIGIPLNYKNSLFDTLIAILPHAIIELFAFCLLATLCYQLNQTIIQQLKQKNDNKLEIIKGALLLWIKNYVVYVLSLIIIAALIEAFITTTLIGL